MRTNAITRIFLVWVAVLLAPVGWAAQPSYDAMYVFGDSLSDTGNVLIATKAQGLVPAIPPSETPYATYYQGRFSNGPVAVEYLWAKLIGKAQKPVSPILAKRDVSQKGAVSLAFGGSASGVSNLTPGGFPVPGVLGQVGMFAAAQGGGQEVTKALYVVWTGANDYIGGLASNPDTVVANIVGAIQSLHALGARDFLVPNLPDIGSSPLIQSQGQATAAYFTQLTQAHNLALAQALIGLAASLPTARFVQLDVYGVVQSLALSGNIVVSPPQLAVVAPLVTVDCLFLNPATCIDVDLKASVPRPFLFWDVLHPTTHVHRAIGAAMFSAMAAVK